MAFMKDTHSGSNLTRRTRITREPNRTLKLEIHTKCYLNLWQYNYEKEEFWEKITCCLCSEVIDLCGNVIVCVCVCVYCIAGVIQGFLWVHRLQVVLVLQKVQQFQVVQPLPSPRALLEDPVSRISELMDAMNQSVKANSILNNSTHKVLKSDPRPLTFFPGSPPIPGGPDSPGSPCGAQQYIL